MKNIRLLLSENFPFFLVVKCSVYLNRHVFVMLVSIKNESWSFFYLTGDILTQLLQKCFLSSPPYVTYEFCPNCWLWLVAMATKTSDLQNIFKTSSSEAIRGMKLNFHKRIIAAVFTISFFLNEKSKVVFFSITLKIFWQRFLEKCSWVVRYIPNMNCFFKWLNWIGC